MGTGLEWILLSLVFLTVSAKVVIVAWAIIELRRKSVPELWGIDWLDILHRLEQEFGVVFSRTDFEAIPTGERLGLTVATLWALVEIELRSVGRSLPKDGWEKMVATLIEALNVAPDKVRSESRLYADLGMEQDLGW